MSAIRTHRRTFSALLVFMGVVGLVPAVIAAGKHHGGHDSDLQLAATRREVTQVAVRAERCSSETDCTSGVSKRLRDEADKLQQSPPDRFTGVRRTLASELRARATRLDLATNANADSIVTGPEHDALQRADRALGDAIAAAADAQYSVGVITEQRHEAQLDLARSMGADGSATVPRA